MIICEWHFVPKVPLSNNAFSYQTHCKSTYCRALILSTALTTKLRLFQKSSLKNYSFSGETFNFKDLKFVFQLILPPIEQAISLLFLPTCSFRNKNCLFRLLISILSSSVTYVRWLFCPRPINENILINSQPSAPEPIIKDVQSAASFMKSSPKRIM